MAAAVRVDFTIGGIGRVNEALEGVASRMRKMEEQTMRDADRAAQARERAVQKETAARAREIEKQMRLGMSMSKDIERLAEKGAKDHAKAEGQKAKASEMLTRELDRLRERQFRDAQKWANAEVRSTERAETEKTRIAEREARARQAVNAKFARAVGGSFSRTTSTAINLAGGALALGGGFGIADSMQRLFAAERTSAQLVNAVTSGGKAPEGATVANIMKQAGAVSIETGTDKDEVVKGALAYARKARGGDFGGAMANMGFFAKMSKVTGASMEEIAGAAGTLQSQNQNLKAPEMQQMLLDVYAQGKAGSMSMTDVVKQIGTLASTRSSYGGNAATNQRKLLALGQLAAPEGSVEEAGTYVKDMTLEAGKKQKQLRAMGVKFNQYGQMDSPEQMIESVFRSTKGDITKIEGLFGVRGKAVFGALQPAYVAAGGGEAGIAAVQKQMASVTSATMTPEELQGQFATSMATTAEKFDKAVNQVREVLMDQLAPQLERFSNALPDLLPKIEAIIRAGGELAEWFTDNPIKGVGALILGSVAKDLASAAIGEGVKRAILAMLGGGGGAPPPGGGGNVLPVVAAGAFGGEIGKYIVDNVTENTQARQRYDTAQYLGGLDSERNGKMTPEQIVEAKKRAAYLSGQMNDLAGRMGRGDTTPTGSFDEKVFAGIASVVSPDDAQRTSEGVAKQQMVQFKEMEASLTDLNKAIADSEKAHRGNADAVGGTNDPKRSQPMTHPARGGTQ